MIVNSQSSNGSIGSGTVPAKRRRIVNNVAAGQQNLELEEENDAEEIRNRRIQHIVEIAQSHKSPANSPAGGRRNISLGQNGMSNMQISEHYASCLKLSAENKINLKNAFNLHLIDFMSDMLHRDDAETNFQVAGTSLDASAKIYAYRVESVHRETLKIAGGLGRPDRESNRADEDDVIGAEDIPVDTAVEQTPKPAKKKRKKASKGNSIETNEKSLNMHIGSSEFAGDALFDKVRSNFDECSSSGLFLNTLSSVNDSNRLLLHCLGSRPPRYPTSADETHLVDPADITELLSKIDIKDATSVCPGFSDFGFVGWKPEIGSDEDCHDGSFTQSDLRGKFVVELPPPTPCQAQLGFGLEDEDSGGGFDHDDNWDTSSVNPVTNDASAMKMVPEPFDHPQGLPCFDMTNTSISTGMDQWKVKAKLHSLKREHVDTAGGAIGPSAKGRKIANGQPRKRKVQSRVSFDEEIDVNMAVPMGTGATLLSKAVLEKWQSESPNLELDDAICDSEKLQQLLQEPYVLLDRIDGKEEPTSAGPAVNVDAHYEGDDRMSDDCGGDDNDDFEFAVPAVPADVGNRAEHNTGEGAIGPIEPPPPADGTDGTSGAAGAFDGGLLPHPSGVVSKVAMPSFDHRPQKIDAKRVKNAMWSILTKDDNSAEGDPGTSNAGAAASSTMTTSKTFSELCNELSDTLPANMVENLSVPVVFVCLLHMCNERTLSLESQEDLADVVIKAGNPDESD